MSFKSQATKEAQEKINKAKKKEETEMKTIKGNSTIKTIVTVFVTLLAVAALVASFYGGTQYQNTINDNTKAQVKEMAAVASKTVQ